MDMAGEAVFSETEMSHSLHLAKIAATAIDHSDLAATGLLHSHDSVPRWSPSSCEGLNA
jgi:hypothetical protein